MPSIGGFLGDTIGRAISQGFEAAMKALWMAALALLKVAFQLADWLSVFSVSTTDGPVGAVWPMMLWVSGMVAAGLFFVQLTSAALKGGQGLLRTVTGPVQYGLALGLTATAVAAFLAAADGLTRGILHYGLDASNFQDALHATGFGDVAIDGFKAMQLGLIALFGVLPSAMGYLLEMLFRQAAIMILVASVPITAAGLLAHVTAKWFWRTVRWLLASIAMKPVLALALTLGVGTFGGADGIKELLIGQGILLISLLAPFALFRLFAFVDPNTEAGSVFRDTLSGMGVDSYPGMPTLGKQGKGDDSEDESGGAIETANAGRFDNLDEHADQTLTTSGTGYTSQSGSADQTGSDSGQQSETDSNTQPGASDDEAEQAPAPPANSGSVVASSPTGGPRGHDDGGQNPPSSDGSDGGGSEPPDPNGGGGPRGGGGPTSGGGGGGAAATGEASEAAETAVIV